MLTNVSPPLLLQLLRTKTLLPLLQSETPCWRRVVASSVIA